MPASACSRAVSICALACLFCRHGSIRRDASQWAYSATTAAGAAGVGRWASALEPRSASLETFQEAGGRRHEGGRTSISISLDMANGGRRRGRAAGYRLRWSRASRTRGLVGEP
jgi:hypothetical protein